MLRHAAPARALKQNDHLVQRHSGLLMSCLLRTRCYHAATPPRASTPQQLRSSSSNSSSSNRSSNSSSSSNNINAPYTRGPPPGRSHWYPQHGPHWQAPSAQHQLTHSTEHWPGTPNTHHWQQTPNTHHWQTSSTQTDHIAALCKSTTEQWRRQETNKVVLRRNGKPRHVRRSIQDALLIANVRHRVVISTTLLLGEAAEVAAAAGSDGIGVHWINAAEHLLRSVCRDLNQHDSLVAIVLAKLLVTIQHTAAQPDEAQGAGSARGELDVVVRRYVSHLLAVIRRSPPLSPSSSSSSSLSWAPTAAGNSSELAAIVDSLAVLSSFSGPIQVSLAGVHVQLCVAIETSRDTRALLRFLSLLTPGDRLPESAAGKYRLVTALLDRLACLFRHADGAQWPIEHDVVFSSACRALSRQRIVHGEFLAALVSLLQQRVRALSPATVYAETFHPGLVANIVYLLGFAAVRAREVVGALVRGVYMPHGSVRFSARDSVRNSITSASSLATTALDHHHGNVMDAPPGTQSSWPDVTALDLLQLAWAAQVQGVRKRSRQLSSQEKLLLEWFVLGKRHLNAAWIHLVLQALDLDDKNLWIPLYACSVSSWRFGVEFAEWMYIVRDLDSDSEVEPEGGSGDEPQEDIAGVCTLGIRPAGLIAALGAVLRKSTLRCYRPARSFQSQLDHLGSVKDYTVARAYVFAHLETQPLVRRNLGDFALAALVLVPDQHVLRAAPASDGLRDRNTAVHDDDHSNGFLDQSYPSGNAPEMKTAAAPAARPFTKSQSCDTLAIGSASLHDSSMAEYTDSSSIPSDTIKSESTQSTERDPSAMITMETAPSLSGAVHAQVALLESWGYVPAVITVAKVMELERRRGQRPRDTCLIAMAKAVRRDNERRGFAGGENLALSGILSQRSGLTQPDLLE